MGKTEKVALIFHANLNHFSLSHTQRDTYMDSALSEMAHNIKVPVSLSMPAEDLLFLHENHPETFHDLVSQQNVNFMLSTYAHTVAEHSYGVYLEQAELGMSVLSSLIPPDKLIPIAYPSEVEPPNQTDLPNLSQIWQGLILGETRIASSQDVAHDEFLLQVDNSVNPIKVFISRRNTFYRDLIHQYFRGEVPASKVVDALVNDVRKFGKIGSSHVARIDLEVPILNEVLYENGSTSGPRIDLWIELMRALQASNIQFSSGFDLVKASIPDDKFISEIHRSPLEDQKWDSPDIEQEIASLRPPSEDFERYIMWLSSHGSDYLCSNQRDFEFHVGNGKILIRKKKSIRADELKDKLLFVASGNQELISNEYVRKVVRLGWGTRKRS